MDRKELRRKEAEQAAIKDKRRLIFAGLGLVLCIVVLVQLKIYGDKASEEMGEQEQSQTEYQAFMPEIDFALLRKVKDGTPNERLTYERDAFDHLLASARRLITSWLFFLGEPAFPMTHFSPNMGPCPFRVGSDLFHEEICKALGITCSRA